MRIWEITSDLDKYKVLNTVDISDIDKFHLFDGRRVEEEWSPLEVKYFKNKKGYQIAHFYM